MAKTTAPRIATSSHDHLEHHCAYVRRPVITLRGVDGCKGGWLCAELILEDGVVKATVHKSAESLFQTSANITAIDIPIGLPSRNPRACDIKARELLKRRASSVFPTPLRSLLGCDSHEAACAISRRECGEGISRQAFELIGKIREVDTTLLKRVELRSHVKEVHPEITFYYWNDKKEMDYSKKTGFGFLERYRLVRRAFADAADRIRKQIPASQASDDDILDALAALWTAQRIHIGNAERLPENSEKDEKGLLMQIVA